MRRGKSSTRTAVYPQIKYTPLWVEALAYHEAGHAVMGLLLGVRVVRIVIAEACDMADSNGITEYADLKKVSRLQYALCQLASEPAERLAPNYPSFKTLRGFATGRRNDKNVAFQTLAPVYLFLRLAESTARRSFRERTQPLLSRIMDQPENQAVVHEVAAYLMAHKEMDLTNISSFRGRTVLPIDVLEEQQA